MLNSLEPAGPAAEPTDAAKQMTETAQKLIRMAGTNRTFDAWKLLMWLEAFLWSILDFPVLAQSLMRLYKFHLYKFHLDQIGQICNLVMGIADISGFLLHWRFARQKRWVHSDIIRVPDLPPIGIRILEVLGAFGLGLPYPVSIFFVFVNTDDPGAPQYACLFVLTLLMLLISMLPHIATTLLVQQDLEHLGVEMKRVCDLGRQEDFMQLLETVSSVKKRWANFLRLHFLCEGAGTAAFVLRELTLVSRFAQKRRSSGPISFDSYARQAFLETPFHIGGGMFAAFLLWQVVSIARFNRHIDVCKEQVRSDTIHRMLLQHERKLQIGVMGVAITHTKIRAILTSVVLSMCGKFFVKLIN